MGCSKIAQHSERFVPSQRDGSDDEHHQKSGSTELNDQQKLIVGGSRWNPTPEQLLALEELYRRGTRTPSTEQIQHIASKLRSFGKIEGKNVFYWFQNHKARERQKRRREATANPACNVIQSLEKKESSVLRRTGNELEQTKSRASSSTCCKLTEALSPLVLSNGTQSETEMRAEDHRHATWQNPMLLNMTTESSLLYPSNPSDTPSYCFISSPLISKPYQENLPVINLEDETGEIQTLELFPIHSSKEENISTNNNTILKGETNVAYTEITANQFFEFIPLKN